MSKRVLIVDDSKTARQVLSGKLQNYDILVDARESALEALNYLYDQAPDAIFMDYEMPGMDGFQALKVIKSNPHTALIPVMMYTSKAGGLALSQARALGAVGVLPKQLEAQDLEDVLKSLHLMPDQEPLAHDYRNEELGDVVRAHRADNVHPIHGGDVANGGMVEPVSLPFDSIEEQATGINGFKRSMRRELGQVEERLQERLDNHFAELHAELFELEEQQVENGRQVRRLQKGSWLVASISLVVLVALFYLFNGANGGSVNGKGLTAHVSELNSQLAAQDEKLNLLIDQLNLGVIGSGAGATSSNLPLGLLEWAANQGTGFSYGEIPFNDDRAFWLSELVDQLKQAGFLGTVELRSYYGNFCLTKSENGGLVLANPELDIGKCLFAAEEKGSESLPNDQSVAFANYLDMELSRSNGEVEILLFSSGFADPLVSYPAPYEVKTAGEWNSVARLNQRVRVSIYAER